MSSNYLAPAPRTETLQLRECLSCSRSEAYGVEQFAGREAALLVADVRFLMKHMFHRTRDAIEARLTIVFTALAVSRLSRPGQALRCVTSSDNSGPYAQRP